MMAMTNHATRINPNLLKNDRERIDFLERENLKIIQSSDYFTMSLDAILLADFIRLPKRPFKYIDFCSGNGIIPMLLANRTQEHLEGIEIQADLVDMARRSLQLNGLDQQIDFYAMDLKEFQKQDHRMYDIISCNPPYFLVEDSNAIHKLNSHAIARHEIHLKMVDWVEKARQIMKDKGKLYIVHRPDRLDDLFELLLRNYFAVNRLKFIYPKNEARANMVLIEAIYRGGRHGVKVERPLIVYDDQGNYSPEMTAIYYGK